MIVRLVKLDLAPDAVALCAARFPEWQAAILAVPGCLSVEMLADVNAPGTVFTHSTWVDNEHLEAYRRSAVFQHIWPQLKAHFNGPPMAWSTRAVVPAQAPSQ